MHIERREENRNFLRVAIKAIIWIILYIHDFAVSRAHDNSVINESLRTHTVRISKKVKTEYKCNKRCIAYGRAMKHPINATIAMSATSHKLSVHKRLEE